MSGYGIQAWGISAGGGGSGEIVRPVVTIITPYVKDRYGWIVVDVTDNVALKVVTIQIEYPTLGITEGVYDGTKFAKHYGKRGSFVATISNGFRYHMRRYSGFPATPELLIKAVDTSGNTNI